MEASCLQDRGCKLCRNQSVSSLGLRTSHVVRPAQHADFLQHDSVEIGPPPLLIFFADVFAISGELYVKLRSQRSAGWTIIRLPSTENNAGHNRAIELGSIEQSTDEMIESYISFVQAPVRSDATHLVLHEAIWRLGLWGQINDPRASFVLARIRSPVELENQEVTENFGLSRSWISPPLSSEEDNLFDSSSTKTRRPVTQKAGQSSFKKEATFGW